MQTSPVGELDSDQPKEASGAATPVTRPSSVARPDPPALTLESPELYINRELSL